jgi:hypothetical protein
MIIQTMSYIDIDDFIEEILPDDCKNLANDISKELMNDPPWSFGDASETLITQKMALEAIIDASASGDAGDDMEQNWKNLKLNDSIRIKIDG